MTELEKSLTKTIEELREENRLLREKLDYVIRQLYGAKSEKLDPNQLELFDEFGEPGKDEASDAEDEAAEALLEPVKNSRPRSVKDRKPRIPENLPVKETIIDPASVKACPKAWRRIGEEVSEQLDIEPARFFRLRTVRPKYVNIANPEAPPIIAPLPDKLLERGILAPGLLTHITISKYCDHLPLYRQEQIFSTRFEVELSRRTMGNGVALVAEWLQPIVEEMIRNMFESGYVQIDETPIKYLAPGTGKTALGYLWTVHCPGGDTVYFWFPGRAGKCLEKIVPSDFRGVIQSDGYQAYSAFCEERDHIDLAGCWAHARRKFVDAYKSGEQKTRAAWLLRQIGLLYDIERELRESRAGPQLREARRQSRSRPIIERIEQTLISHRTHTRLLPESLFGKAVNYALNQRDTLKAYLDDGRVEIDNNLCENAIRPTAVGKKNWMFVGSKEAGWISATIYSIVTSCRNRGIDPSEYLKDVLERLPSMTNHQIPEITPQAWIDDTKALPAVS